MFVLLAIVGCASDKFAGTQQVGSPSAGGDVTGTWTVTWGPLMGGNAYADTLVDTLVASGGGDSIVTTIVPHDVTDSCNAAGSLTLTQGSPVTYVTGTWSLTGTCVQTEFNDAGAVIAADTAAFTPAPLTGSIENANVGSGRFTFSLGTGNTRVQYGLINANTVDGTAKWVIKTPTRPTKSNATMFGGFAATK